MAPKKPHHLEHAIHAAQRRQRIQHLITGTGRCLTASTLTALVLLLLTKNLPFTLPMWIIITTACLGLPVGLALALRMRLSDHDAATSLDEFYQLKNRLASALSLRSSNQAGTKPAPPASPPIAAVAELLNRDAEHVAARLNPNPAFPLNWTPGWSTSTTIILTLIAALIWLPDLSTYWFDDPIATLQAAEIAADETAAEAIREASERLQKRRAEIFGEEDQEQTDGDDTNETNQTEQLNDPNKETDAVLQTLEDLSTQLARSNTQESEQATPNNSTAGSANQSPDQSIAEAAAALDNLAEELAADAELERQQTESVLEHFSSLADDPDETASAAGSTPTATEQANAQELQELLESLQQGNTAQAAESVAELDRQLQEQTPEERAAFAEKLRQLAEKIDQSTLDENELPTDQTPAELEPSLTDSSPDASPDEPAQDVDEIVQRLEDEGFDPETARAVAEDIQAQEQARKIEESAEDQVSQTADEFRNWADDLEEPADPQATEEPRPNESTENNSATATSEEVATPSDPNNPNDQENQEYPADDSADPSTPPADQEQDPDGAESNRDPNNETAADDAAENTNATNNTQSTQDPADDANVDDQSDPAESQDNETTNKTESNDPQSPPNESEQAQNAEQSTRDPQDNRNQTETESTESNDQEYQEQTTSDPSNDQSEASEQNDDPSQDPDSSTNEENQAETNTEDDSDQPQETDQDPEGNENIDRPTTAETDQNQPDSNSESPETEDPANPDKPENLDGTPTEEQPSTPQDDPTSEDEDPDAPPRPDDSTISDPRRDPSMIDPPMTGRPTTDDQDPQADETESPTEEPPTNSDAAERIQDILKNLDATNNRADQKDELSDEARKEAQRLIEKMTPAEREELARWAAEQAKDNQDQNPADPQGEQANRSQPNDDPNELDSKTKTGDNNHSSDGIGTQDSKTPRNQSQPPAYDYSIEDLDARPETLDDPEDPNHDRVLSEWSKPDTAADDKTGDSSNALPNVSTRPARELSAAEMAKATRAIERALNDEAIAPRYRELLKRWTAKLAKQKPVSPDLKPTTADSNDQ